jgi:hypothetical protein
VPDEHDFFFNGPGEKEPDFSSTLIGGRGDKAGTVECKPENINSNMHGAAFIIRYTILYKEGKGKF